jgi:iron complex outermembrane receptor protein
MKASFKSKVSSLKSLKLIIICISTLLTSYFSLLSSLFAEENAVFLEEVVVTATRYEEKLTNVPAFVAVISEEDIQASTAQNIPDLLRTETGVHVNDITGNRRTFTVDLRGFGETASSNTLVLIDGRRVNEADLSGVDWTQIPLERVKRIEIIRGGRGSVLYGDNATGGVINIITKEGDKIKAGGELAAGSYNTFRSNAYFSGSLNNLSFQASGRYFTSGGYRDNSDTEAKDFGMNLSYYVRDLMKLNFSSGYHKDNTGLPGALKESDFDTGFSRTESKFPHDFSEVEDYYFKVSPDIYLVKDSTFRIDMSFRKRAYLSFASGDWGNSLGESEIKTVALSPQFLLKNNIKNVKNSFVLGLDYQNADDDIGNDLHSLFFGTTTKSFELQKENSGYYIHDEINIADIFYLSGGYRHDRAEFTFDPGTPDKIVLDEDLYTAGINYTFSKKSYVYFSFSRSFRYPLLDELYSFYTNTVNTDLIPQISDNYEFGIRHYFNDETYAHLNFFRIDTDNEIFLNPITYTNENLDGMSRRNGIEISFSAKANKWVTIKGGYTYLDATIKGGTFKGGKVPNVPKHMATLGVVSPLGRGFTISFNGAYIGKRPFISDFSNAFDNQKSYIVLNSRIQYQWRSLKAFLDINNVTNRKYSEFGVLGGFPVEKAFYPSPKRNFLVGLSIDL